MKKIGFLVLVLIVVMNFNNALTGLKNVAFNNVEQSLEQNILMDLPDAGAFDIQ